MWLRIVLRAPVGVDDGLDGLADLEPAVERAAMDDRGRRPASACRHREQVAAAARLAEDALVADLAAALGVERRPVEDDLGLAVAGQLVELQPVADDRDDAALGGRRLVAEELVSPARAWIAPYSAVSSACFASCAFVPQRLRSRCSASAASNPSRSTATPYSAASSTVRSIGKPYVSCSRNAMSPGSRGASAGRSSGRRPTTRSRVPAASLGDRLLEQLRARRRASARTAPPRGR